MDLEEKTDAEPYNNAGHSESKGKSTFVKLPKFDLPQFYEDSESGFLVKNNLFPLH